MDVYYLWGFSRHADEYPYRRLPFAISSEIQGSTEPKIVGSQDCKAFAKSLLRRPDQLRKIFTALASKKNQSIDIILSADRDTDQAEQRYRYHSLSFRLRGNPLNCASVA
jgi:hypothetical protein